jgi:hypothetical protein
MEGWHIAVALVALLTAYGLIAYVILPAAWTHHERQPGLAVRPMTTQTKQGIPGDPMNVGMVGSRGDLIQAMHAAGWYPADPITLRSRSSGALSLIGPTRTRPSAIFTTIIDARIWPSRNRRGRARTRAIMSVSGWSSTMERKAGRCGSARRPSIAAWASAT